MTCPSLWARQGALIHLSTRRAGKSLSDAKVPLSKVVELADNARMRRLVSTLCAVFLAVATHASAQSLFVDGVVSGDIERRPYVQDSSLGFDLTVPAGGMVPGGGFGIGTMLNPQFSIRLEMHWQGALDSSTEQNATYVMQARSASEQTTTGAVLVGYHPPRRGAVQLGYLGGVLFAHSKYVSENSIVYSLSDLLVTLPPGSVVTLPSPQNYRLESSSYGVTAQVGLDADIELTPRLSFVPQVRAFAGGGLSVRPGVALRARW